MRRVLLAGSIAFLFASNTSPAYAQPPRPLLPNEPVPKGQRIDVKDGDTVVIHGDARVRIVRRSEASVRAIYNTDQRWLVLLVDYVDPQKGAPDGTVDSTYSFQEVEGSWPLGERWQGSALLDDYSMPHTPNDSLGITTDAAFIQMFQGSPASNNRWFLDSRAITVFYRGGNRANTIPGRGGQTFDEAEERAIGDAVRNAQQRGVSTTTYPTPGGGTATSTLRMTGGVVMTPGSRPPVMGEYPPPAAAVRVGSTIATPQKMADAKPVVPADAQQAGVRGVVILEITVGADGSVTDAKVLRGVFPSLDKAALDAVRQWRYEPTQLNGRPVPVIMTVTVAF